MSNPRDVDFENLMRSQGVSRLGQGGTSEKAKKAARLAATDAAPPPPPAGPAPLGAETVKLLRQAAVELRQAEARAEAAAQEAKAQEAAKKVAEARAADAEKAVETLKAAVAAAEARAVAAERRPPPVAAPPAPTPKAPTTERPEAAVAIVRLDELLQRAGFTDASGGFAHLVTALEKDGRLGELLERIRVAKADEVRRFLEDKVARVCRGCAPTAGPGLTIFNVESRECDLCGGSSLQAATKRFEKACQGAGVSRVLIVGGSPRYHDVLRAMGRTLSVKLEIVRGDAARDRQRANADLAGADVCFIWASTVLDHKVSDQYGGPKVQVLPVRGVGRMLQAAAERLEGRPA